MVLQLPQSRQPGHIATREWQDHQVRGIVSGVRSMPRHRFSRLEGGTAWKANGDVEWRETVPAVRQLPFATRPGLQVAQSTTPPDEAVGDQGDRELTLLRPIVSDVEGVGLARSEGDGR